MRLGGMRPRPAGLRRFRARRAWFAPAGAFLLAGCTLLDPYATDPRAAHPGESAAGPRVAICYNTLETSLPEVQSAAQQECGAKTVAQSVATDWYLQRCPLLLPARATFVCAPTK